MEKELLDNMLEIIRINNNKISILNRMLELEKNNKLDSSEYINFVDLYKRVSSNLVKIKDNLDIKERLIIARTMCRLNPIMCETITFKETISNKDDHFLVFKKTLIDLGSELMILYQEDRRELIKKELAYVYSLFGVSSGIEEPKIDSELVNHYMVCDYTNSLYSQINNLLNNETLEQKDKDKLLKLKYNTIFFAPNIETRAIQTAFLIPNNPRLTDQNAIVDTGMDYYDYINKLDSVMIELLEDTINNSLHYSNLNNTNNNLIDLLFMKAYASLLNDTELLDLIQLDKTNANSNNYIMLSEMIQDVLDQSKIISRNNPKLRMYGRI